MAFPTQDTALAGYSTNFNDRIVAAPSDFGLSAPQAAAYTAVHDPYLAAQAAVVAARESGTRSGSLVAARKSAGKSLLALGREYYATIQADSEVTDENKVLLGVVVRALPSPVPAPDSEPQLTVTKIFGHMISLDIRAAGSTKRARPKGCIGVTLFSYVGETPPAGTTGWLCQGNVTRNTIDVDFPDAAPGSKVWFTAYWYSLRGLAGPACTPIWSNVGFEGAAPIAA